MEGTFNVYKDEKTGKNFYACIVKDATACCEQGIEFVLEGDNKYPDDYPKNNGKMKVIGTFNSYEEDGKTYVRLEDAVLCK